MPDAHDKKQHLILIAMSVVGTIISSAIRIPTPLGAFATVVYLFYKHIRQNPFKVDEEALRRYIRDARDLEIRYENELKDLQRVKERVMKKEVLVDDIESLELRIKQLEEKIKLVKANKKIVEAMLIVKENVELFDKLFEKELLRKIAADPGELSAAVDKLLEVKGIKEVDLEALAEQLKAVLPLIIKEPEKFAAEEPVEVGGEARPEEKVELDVMAVYRLIDGGSVQRWAEEVDRASREGRKIRIPPITSRDLEKIGYKNLLVVVYSTDLEKLRSAVDNKLILRLAELISKLKSTGILELSPTSSDIGYLDEFLETVKYRKEERASSDAKVEVYEFRDASSGVVRIEKTIVKDPKGKALKVLYKLVSAAS